MSLFLDLVRREKELELPILEEQLGSWDTFVDQGGLKPKFVFSKAIKRSVDSYINIIGEIKPSSPSTNNFELNTTFNLQDFVQKYESGGVNALSVLTDNKHFSGSYDLLKKVTESTSLPVLQKEFVIDFLQMKLGRLSGASAVLLLTHYFTQIELEEKVRQAESIGLEPVVEISVLRELDVALKVNPKILLVNNRPISLLPADPSVDYEKGSVNFSRVLWESREDLQEWKKQEDRLLISASCYNSSEDLKVIEDLPFDCILMGNALSSSLDPKEFLHKFKQGNM